MPKSAFDTISRGLPRYPQEVVELLIELAVEIAREGREGRRIGTLFTLGDEQTILRMSRPLILDPLACHPRESRMIQNPNLQGTIKELAQLDGAFIVSGDGEFCAACRYLEASSETVDLPLGLGSRHLVAASISAQTDAVGIVVSESAIVRIFSGGKLVAEVLPEFWLLGRRILQLRGRVREEHVSDLAVITPETDDSTGG